MLILNELRLGNMIERITTGEQCTVTSKNINDVFEFSGLGYDGIPLTKEWLLRMGFEKLNAEWGVKINSRKTEADRFVVYQVNDMFMFGVGNMYIKTVHQLQNLYFALTGQELQIIKEVTQSNT